MKRFARMAIPALGCVLLAWAGFAKPPTVHSGMAGASAAVDLGDGRFAVANDEDNRIRIYRADSTGAPEAETDLSGFLRVHGRNTEADIEGAARIGNRIYWIGSHGLSKDGKARPNRHRFFATEVVPTAGGPPAIVPVGKPCVDLLTQFASSAVTPGFDLSRAMTIPPNEPGGLNIEALAAGPEGILYIGFRSPIPSDKALLVPLLNPADVVAGHPARFGTPLSLDLDGRGVRDLVWDGQQWYLLGGGGGGEDRKPRLYRWEGPGRTALPLSAKGLKDLNPEAVTLLGSGRGASLLICSDDASGSGGKSSSRNFRSLNLPVEVLR
jgi:hypothetical protein